MRWLRARSYCAANGSLLAAGIQAEEIEVLQVRCCRCCLTGCTLQQLTGCRSPQSIYESDFQFKDAFDDPDGVRCFTVAVPGAHAIQLLVHLPLGYPTTDAPIAEVYESRGLTNAQRARILQDLVRHYKLCLVQVVPHSS